jgi:branched-chain amino acid transport system ATP-binding protein
VSGVLEIEQLVVRYGDAQAVRGVSLHVARGEALCLLGRNGAGKSSILRAVAGLARFEGSVRLLGRDVVAGRAHDVARAGGSLVPEGRELFADMTVEDNLLLGARGAVLRFGRVRRLPQLADVLERFPVLADRRHQLAGTLSGGEQQMLAIGRALMGSPQVLLLDEPSLGLAPRIVEQVYDVLRGLRREGLSMVVVEESPQRAIELADRAVVLDRGRLVFDGTAAELREDPRLIEGLYLKA